MPPNIELEQVYGFGLFMLKAVLSGRGQRTRRACRDQHLPVIGSIGLNRKSTMEADTCRGPVPEVRLGCGLRSF